MKRILAVFGVLACAAIPSYASVSDITSLYNTGVLSDGSLAPGGSADLHYTLISSPALGASPAYVLENAPPVGTYTPNDLVSQWISQSPVNYANEAPGIYEYQTTFSLSGFNPSTASISGGWGSDNQGIGISLNGGSLFGADSNDANFESFPAVSFTINSGFVAGTNTLDFYVYNEPYNNGANPEALRVEFTSATAASTPEPGFYGLLALGLSGLVVVVSQRRKASKA